MVKRKKVKKPTNVIDEALLGDIELVARQNQIEEAVKFKIQERFSRVPWDAYVNTVLSKQIQARVEGHLDQHFDINSAACNKMMAAIATMAVAYVQGAFSVEVVITPKKPR